MSITRGPRPNYYTTPVTLESDESQAELDAIEEIRARRFKKAMALKESIGLTGDERRALAQLLLGVDKDYGGSWRELNPKQLHDLITMMEGYAYISYILQQRLDREDDDE